MKRILAENLQAALRLALCELTARKLDKSAMVDGFREIITAIDQKEQIVVRDE